MVNVHKYVECAAKSVDPIFGSTDLAAVISQPAEFFDQLERRIKKAPLQVPKN